MEPYEIPTYQCKNFGCKQIGVAYHSYGVCPECNVALSKIGPAVELLPIDTED